ncbi:MAG TPA: tRNA (N(6)-L-threonylcarbamoyladenosine(37)-C(2))-methylthiotransferase MtaB [Gemmataceae bacterium]|nr:tRNA (N(6)-L-threonylcarbamoyladenosine(37)-C(2))-methylthiotransferase MtaB [Gemmataceae bacterium]
MTAATPTCRLLTLGCKVNQYETQYVKEALEASGYVEARADQPADLCVVNTCTVTAEGDAKSRQLVRRLHQHNPQAAIVVMGCYATRDPETVARLPGVAKVVTDKQHVLDDLRPFGVKARPPGISRFDGHQRAFVKVQDGCLLRCSFCIIPQVRPVVRSRPVDEIVAEGSRLVAAGYQEIVLTGIHLGHYGIDLSRGKPRSGWTRLWHLLEELGSLPGNFRIRLSSLEAAEARDNLIRVMASQPRVCPHLHLCLQSGSDRILAAMRRRYRSAGFVERCHRIRAALDRPGLSTDIIVGFPGETDEDFEATCRVVREVGFSRLHVFSYSPRHGTAAALLADSVPPGVKAERRQRLLELERELADRYSRSLVGTTLDVLVEGEDSRRPGQVRGTSCRYVPVSFRGHAPALVRRRVPVRVIGTADDALLGEPAIADGLVPPSTRDRSDGWSRVALPLVANGTGRQGPS